MAPPLAVCVIDDDAPVLDSLVRLFTSDGLEARGFGSGEAFLDALPVESLGCLVLDVRMPGMDGLELQRRLIERGLDVPIVFLTGHGDVPMSAAAFRSGAFDFLEKPADGDELLARVRAGLERAERARDVRARRAGMEARLRRLTDREREVMSRVVAGLSSKEIARELGVSHRTVEAHRSQVMQKTGAKSLPALVEIATECGFARPKP